MNFTYLSVFIVWLLIDRHQLTYT